MSALTDTMAADASARLTQRINRSAGQHSRHVRASFAQITANAMNAAAVAEANKANQSRFYEAGSFIDFAGDEPDEPHGLAMFGRVIGALAFIVLVVVAVLILNK